MFVNNTSRHASSPKVFMMEQRILDHLFSNFV